MSTGPERSEVRRAKRKYVLRTAARILFFYALIPALLLVPLAGPIGGAARRSGTAAFLILFAAAAAACANGYIYFRIRKERPTLPVYAHGVLCVLAVALIQHDALPGDAALTAAMAYVVGFLALVYLLLMSFWFASRRSRPAHAAAVGLRIIVWAVLFFMAYQVFRDIESRIVSRDTWITAGILLAIILARFSPRIIPAVRGAVFRRRASGRTEGQILQIVGETFLDRDDDPYTVSHARVRYTVDGAPYETQAAISRHMIRKYGKPAFVGKEIPVRYDPAHPAAAYAGRINGLFFDTYRDRYRKAFLSGDEEGTKEIEELMEGSGLGTFVSRWRKELSRKSRG